QTTSTLKMSTSVAPAASSCCASASFSVDEVGLVTTLALLPVFWAQSSAPDLQVSKSLPTEPHDSVISTGAGAAAGVVAGLVGSAGLGADSSADFFLQPPARHSDIVRSTVVLFIRRIPFLVDAHSDYNLAVPFCNLLAHVPTH